MDPTILSVSACHCQISNCQEGKQVTVSPRKKWLLKKSKRYVDTIHLLPS